MSQSPSKAPHVAEPFQMVPLVTLLSECLHPFEPGFDAAGWSVLSAQRASPSEFAELVKYQAVVEFARSGSARSGTVRGPRWLSNELSGSTMMVTPWGAACLQAYRRLPQ